MSASAIYEIWPVKSISIVFKNIALLVQVSKYKRFLSNIDMSVQPANVREFIEDGHHIYSVLHIT